MRGVRWETEGIFWKYNKKKLGPEEKKEGCKYHGTWCVFG